MSSLNSFKGLRLYYQLPLVLQASTFPNYQLLDSTSTQFTFSQYLVYFLSLIYYKHIFSRQFHHYYLSRYFSIKNRPSLNIKSTLSYYSVRCYLYIYLAFLYLRFSSTQYILIGYFLCFIFSALCILYLLSIYIIYTKV